MNYLSILRKSSLFNNLAEKDIEILLKDIPYIIKHYKENENIVLQNDILENIGIIIDGYAQGIKLGMDGQEVIVSDFYSADIFGDVLSGAMGFNSPVNIKAKDTTSVLYIPYKAIITSSNNKIHIVLQNMIQNISLKYFQQNQRLDILTLKTLREKIIAYLKIQATLYKKTTFIIPLNRQMLADYLFCERSALSRELSKMQNENLLTYNKNRFTINF